MNKLDTALLLKLNIKDKELLQEKAREKRMSLSGYIRNELLINYLKKNLSKEKMVQFIIILQCQ